MTQLAVHAKNGMSSGREQKTDGLWKHLGMIDAGSLRVTNNLTVSMTSGAGLELLYAIPILTSYIQSYDRDLNVWRDLIINARSITLAPQAPGTLVLPAGSVGTAAIADGAVTTAKIAANAAQQLIGSYIGAPPFSTTVVGSWIETPFQVTAVFSGAPVRIEGVLPLYHSVVGAGMYVGWGIDGAIGRGNVYCNAPAPNYTLTNSFVDYYTPNAGTHRWSLFVYNATAGTLSFNAAVYAMLHLTEQKR
jgi:hypothetical protein